MDYFFTILNQSAGEIPKWKWQGIDILLWLCIYLVSLNLTNELYSMGIVVLGIIVKEQFDEDCVDKKRHLIWNKSLQENRDSLIDITQAIALPVCISGFLAKNLLGDIMGVVAFIIYFSLWIFGNLAEWTHENQEVIVL